MNDAHVILQDILIILSAIMASSGFWAFIVKRTDKTSASTKLLMGLAYDKISTVGMRYIERGWISKEEYEEFRVYLFDPYKDLGGNGTAEKIMEEVSKLPFRSGHPVDEIIQTIKTSKGDGLSV